MYRGAQQIEAKVFGIEGLCAIQCRLGFVIAAEFDELLRSLQRNIDVGRIARLGARIPAQGGLVQVERSQIGGYIISCAVGRFQGISFEAVVHRAAIVLLHPLDGGEQQGPFGQVGLFVAEHFEACPQRGGGRVAEYAEDLEGLVVNVVVHEREGCGAVLHGARIFVTPQVGLGAEGIALPIFGSELHHVVEECDGAVVVFACHCVAPHAHIGIGVAFVELLHLLVVAVGEIVALHLVVEVAALLDVVTIVGREANGRADVGEGGRGVGECQVDECAFGVGKGKRLLVFLRQILECLVDGGEGVAVFVVVEADEPNEEMGVAVARVLFERRLELLERFALVFVVLQHFEAAFHVVVLEVLTLLRREGQEGEEENEQHAEQAGQRAGSEVCHSGAEFEVMRCCGGMALRLCGAAGRFV